MRVVRRRSGHLEDAIVALLGDGEPLLVADVRDRIDPSLAHTTVMTALVRLTGKGLVVREKQGRAFVYSLAAPVDSLPALRAALRMRTELDARSERADVLANFVAALDPEDEETLLNLLSDSASRERDHP
ncbi:BlaI/MecI/CopY family transcriptional regulator [Actinomycetes bacterium M1A6_2h]